MRRPHGKRFRWLLSVGSVELAQIPRHALLKLRQPAIHLRPREILVARVHRFELATVNGNARRRQQAKLSAERNKPRAYLAYRSSVILAKIGNRLVIRNQPTGEPHRLNVAPGLTLKPPARLNPVEIAVDVELQQHRWMVGGSSGCFRIDTAEAKLCKIELVDKDINRANRIILANPIFQAFREQRALCTIHALNKAPHP